MYTVGTDDVGDGLVRVEQQQDLGWSTVEHNPRALSSSPSTDSGSLPREPSSRGERGLTDPRMASSSSITDSPVPGPSGIQSLVDAPSSRSYGEQVPASDYSDDAMDDLSSPITNLRAFLNYSTAEETVLEENQSIRIGSYDPGGEETGVLTHWKEKNLQVKKFIDDVSGSEKLHAGNVYTLRVEDLTDEVRYVHAPLAQDLFDRVRDEAAGKGMKLNENKTTMLCISAAKLYKPRSYININSSDIVLSGKNMKLLGFHFDSRPSVDAHVAAILKKVRYHA